MTNSAIQFEANGQSCTVYRITRPEPGQWWHGFGVDIGLPVDVTPDDVIAAFTLLAVAQETE